MSNNANPAGWVVQVSIPAPFIPASPRGGIAVAGTPAFLYFNVAVANPDKAMAATTRHMADAAPNDGTLSVVRRLSSAEIATLSLNVGDVRPA